MRGWMRVRELGQNKIHEVPEWQVVAATKNFIRGAINFHPFFVLFHFFSIRTRDGAVSPTIGESTDEYSGFRRTIRKQLKILWEGLSNYTYIKKSSEKTSETQWRSYLMEWAKRAIQHSKLNKSICRWRTSSEIFHTELTTTLLKSFLELLKSYTYKAPGSNPVVEN